MADDPEPKVREAAIRRLGELGKAGREPLQQLSRHRSRVVHKAAAEALRQLEQRQNEFRVESYEKRPLWLRSVPTLLAAIDPLKSSRKSIDHRDVQQSIADLGFHGPKASPAIGTLRELLAHESHWVRIHAARALWRITSDPPLVLPTLIQELEPRPAGLLVLDCLRQIGAPAEVVLPILRSAADAERRSVTFGATSQICALDEAYRDACLLTAADIEAQIARPRHCDA
jgi:hypothetical protein